MYFIVTMNPPTELHMANSEHPLFYCHLNIAGSSGDLPDVPSGIAVTAVVKTTFKVTAIK